MRKLSLKEKEGDLFLRLENAPKGALLSIWENNDLLVGQFLLTIKQVGQLREWCTEQGNDFFKRNRIDTKGGK